MLDSEEETEWWEFIPLAADPSRLPKLPAEICERILDECDGSDWKFPQDRESTFGACCLACRAWLPRSRYHLYKHVTVRSKEQVKQVSKLLRCIPALRTRVKRLRVVGSNDRKMDAPWLGLVGFHLGPKLKALNEIWVQEVDFSLMKLEAYTFWGALNRAWRPDATRVLDFRGCKVTHLNQLIRLASVTKAMSIFLYWAVLNEEVESAPPVPILPSGISHPLSKFTIDHSPIDTVLHIPWHTLAEQLPSLSHAEFAIYHRNVDLTSPDGQLFLVSLLCMFHRMQRHSDTSYVDLTIFGFPSIIMRTSPCDKSADADDTPLATQPRPLRKLALVEERGQSPSEAYVGALTFLEDAMVLANYTNRRFPHIEIHDAQPDSLQSLDGILSRLLIATHDVHVIIEGEDGPQEGCVASWAKEHFPMLTSVVPNAFCDPEAGHPCESHLTQASGVEHGQEVKEG